MDSNQNLADYIFISCSSVSGGNLRDGYATTDIHIFDDGDMWASLCGQWSSPQLRRMNVALVRFDLRVANDPVHSKCEVSIKGLDGKDRKLNVSVPTMYVLAPEKIDLLATMPKYVATMTDCVVVAGCELFMHKLSKHWCAVLKHFRALAALQGKSLE